MHDATLTSPIDDGMEPDALAFYRHVMETLNASGIPFLVGGAYAFNFFTGISRQTKDLDVFIRREDYERISQVLSQAGYATEFTYPHWLAKVHCNGEFIDLIFGSGNGIAVVDDVWFDHAPTANVLDVPVKISPIEEMIWSKAFIMERERFDGADIAHLILTCSDQIDWQHLLTRFDPHWRLLLSHLMLFTFVYPAHRKLVPAWVMDNLVDRLKQESAESASDDMVCYGTLLSREQYLMDIGEWGYRDARLTPLGNMTTRDTASWTAAIRNKHP